MARSRGAQNYKKEVLLELVKEILLSGAYTWEQVANLYQERSGEKDLHDKDDLTRHWVEKLCNKFKKPTGSAGGAKDFILACQKVQAKIHKKCESTLMGARSEEEDVDDSGSDDEYHDAASCESKEESKEEDDGNIVDGGVENDKLNVPALPPLEKGQSMVM